MNSCTSGCDAAMYAAYDARRVPPCANAKTERSRIPINGIAPLELEPLEVLAPLLRIPDQLPPTPPPLLDNQFTSTKCSFNDSRESSMFGKKQAISEPREVPPFANAGVLGTNHCLSMYIRIRSRCSPEQCVSTLR